MKKLIILILCMFLTSTVYAEVYLTYDSKTNEIKDLSKRKDVVLQKGWERIELPGKLIDYNGEFQYRPTMYKYKNGNIILNVGKMSKRALAEKKTKEKQKELNMIEKQMMLDALKKLKKKGKKFNHISEKDFE